MAEVTEHEKSIVSFGSVADGPGSGGCDRAGSAPCGGDSSLLWRLLPSILGFILGTDVRPLLLLNPDSGTVKLDTKVKDAAVYINGAYAGTTKDNKTMHLRPGEYNIEIRAYGQPFARRVYVVADKTLHLHPEF